MGSTNAIRHVESEVGLAEVENIMRRVASSHHPDKVSSWFGEFVETGGKRLRARIALSAADCLGTSRFRAAPWGAAVELMHNATLIHDDIQDQDRFRRGHETTWVRHGTAQAINVGDFGLMLPFAVVGEMDESPMIRAALSKVLAAQGIRAARGQRDMLGLLPERRLDAESYTQAVGGTTGSFFSLPVQGSALLAGCSEAEARLIGDSFMPLGYLFQVQDDILDLYGDKGRDKRGSDIRDGKVSALVVEHLRRVPSDLSWLIPLLEAPREKTPDDQVELAIIAFRRSGALQGCLKDIETTSRSMLESPMIQKHRWLAGLAAEFVALVLSPLRCI